jgi:hypothetical protein
MAQTSPQAASAGERWTAYSKTAVAITGDVTFAPDRITFGNGKFLPLAPAGSIPGYSALGKNVTASLFRVTAPANPLLLHGNRLCSAPVTQIVISRVPAAPPLIPALIVMEPFSGQGKAQVCGGYNFEAGGP